MISFKTYLEEKLASPTDMGIFKRLVYNIQSYTQHYKEGIDRDSFEGDGFQLDFMINFKGTPFEKLGRRKLYIILNDNFTYNQYFYNDQLIQLNINTLVAEYPGNRILNHELVHYLQDLSKRHDIPWGTAPKSRARKYKNSRIHRNKPNEYLANLIEYFEGIRSSMSIHKLNKSEVINYMTGKNDSLDNISELLYVKGWMANMMKRSPDLAQRYIKKLYTSL
mgnify:CR=1 FL=1